MRRCTAGQTPPPPAGPARLQKSAQQAVLRCLHKPSLSISIDAILEEEAAGIQLPNLELLQDRFWGRL